MKTTTRLLIARELAWLTWIIADVLHSKSASTKRARYELAASVYRMHRDWRAV